MPRHTHPQRARNKARHARAKRKARAREGPPPEQPTARRAPRWRRLDARAVDVPSQAPDPNRWTPTFPL